MDKFKRQKDAGGRWHHIQQCLFCRWWFYYWCLDRHMLEEHPEEYKIMKEQAKETFFVLGGQP